MSTLFLSTKGVERMSRLGYSVCLGTSAFQSAPVAGDAIFAAEDQLWTPKHNPTSGPLLT